MMAITDMAISSSNRENPPRAEQLAEQLAARRAARRTPRWAVGEGRILIRWAAVIREWSPFFIGTPDTPLKTPGRPAGRETAAPTD